MIQEDLFGDEWRRLWASLRAEMSFIDEEKERPVDTDRYRKYLRAKGWTWTDGYWHAPESWGLQNGPSFPVSQK